MRLVISSSSETPETAWRWLETAVSTAWEVGLVGLGVLHAGAELGDERGVVLVGGAAAQAGDRERDVVAAGRAFGGGLDFGGGDGDFDRGGGGAGEEGGGGVQSR